MPAVLHPHGFKVALDNRGKAAALEAYVELFEAFMGANRTVDALRDELAAVARTSTRLQYPYPHRADPYPRTREAWGRFLESHRLAVTRPSYVKDESMRWLHVVEAFSIEFGGGLRLVLDPWKPHTFRWIRNELRVTP